MQSGKQQRKTLSEISCSDNGIQQQEEEQEGSGSPGPRKDLKGKLKLTRRMERNFNKEGGPSIELENSVILPFVIFKAVLMLSLLLIISL